MLYKNYYSSPLGEIFLSADEFGLTGLYLVGQKYFDKIENLNIQQVNLPIFEETKAWLDVYFSGTCPTFTPNLHIVGTKFRKEVWKVLREIPYGQTITYGDIAKIIAKQNNIEKMSAQAVGNAVGHNNISIIIPCHRVIASNGSLCGYAGGLENKIKLLHLENPHSYFNI